MIMTIFLTLLLLAGPALPAAPAAMTTAPETLATVPLKLIGGKPTVSVTINGKGPFDFFLDTGAGATVLNSDLAEELQLPITGKTRIGDPANPQAIEAKLATVKHLTIGSAAFDDVEVVTWDRDELYRGGGPRGVIGNPLFADLLLTLDLGKGEARIARGAVALGPDVVTYVPSEGGVFRIPISIGALTMDAAIDSGSPSGLALPKRYVEQLPLATPLAEVGRGKTANSDFVLYSATVGAPLRIGSQTFERPLVTFNDVLPGALFGAQILRNLVMTIDQKNRRIQLTPGTPPSALVKVAPGAVGDYAGRFGIRTITSKDGDLFLQRDGGPLLKLVAAGNDEFTLEGIAGARLRFTRDAAGKVTSLEVLNPAGQWEKARRDNG
jgi:predicted aspartyl protease